MSQVIGYIKSKSAIHIAKNYAVKSRNIAAQSFRARGYFVTTIDRDKKVVWEYIKQQQQEDQRIDQLKLFAIPTAFERLTVFNTALRGSQFKPLALLVVCNYLLKH